MDQTKKGRWFQHYDRISENRIVTDASEKSPGGREVKAAPTADGMTN